MLFHVYDSVNQTKNVQGKKAFYQGLTQNHILKLFPC